MANFKICLRNINSVGVWPVYIRITHLRQVGYVKTDWVVDKKGVGRNGEVKDPFVIENCMSLISGFIRRINGIDISQWNVKKLKSFLVASEGNVTFSVFARRFIDRLESLGRVGNAKVYTASLRSIERYMCSENIKFRDIDRQVIDAWVVSLIQTKRAKTLYPKCLRTIFEEAIRVSHDPMTDLPNLRYNPLKTIDIPDSEQAMKRAIDVRACRRFFETEIPQGRKHWTENMGRDVALLSFCLAGMNTVDIWGLRKENLKNGVINYRRTKTRTRRKDGAYFEMRVGSMAAELIEKYKASEDSPWLLVFSEMYRDGRSFNAVVNKGIKIVCKYMGLMEEEWYSFYSFRHTWATLAQNQCGASLSEVGFAMNHIQHDAVTRGYINIDFTPAWELNERVIDVVFGGSSKPTDVAARDVELVSADSVEMVSPDSMIYARAYFRGNMLAEVGDIGFKSVEEVIARLANSLPDTIPDGGVVHFRIKNVDADKEEVYERIKGKGF